MGTRRLPTLALFFLSGFTGLVYELLWMKELGLLFGNTALAATTTLAAFFLGLAVGGAVWGRIAARVRNPLRCYALLEACVAGSALLYFLLLDLYEAAYAPLFQAFGPNPGLFMAVKFALAVGVLLPPAFFMGGTLPVMSQHLVRDRNTLGRTTSLLYAVNTVGAALGAYVAGFHLPPMLGFQRSYIFAISLTALVAALAWLLGSRPAESIAEELPAAEKEGETPLSTPISTTPSFRTIRTLAFLSGFVTLGLEVLWTRMFSQVLQNSVYTYSLILVTFLISLALGAGLAHLLLRLKAAPIPFLCVLLLLAAALVGLSPFVFTWISADQVFLGGGGSFASYVLSIFGSAALVMLLPGILLGCVLPFLIRISQPHCVHSGRTVGDLVSVNTLGAIGGSLAAGFLLLPWLGLWNSIRLMAGIYCLVPLVIALVATTRRLPLGAASLAGLLALLTVLDSSGLPLVRLFSSGQPERLLEVWEGSSATVAVVERGQALKLMVNNTYTLGGTDSLTLERRQSYLPLNIHPHPRSVFYLGMGTGITAGAAFDHPGVEQVVVCELVPEAVEASEKYFGPYVNGLFSDPRAQVVVEDGRNYLRGTTEQFDAIIADLFVPWRVGVGGLYSTEHFGAVLKRLAPSGLFAQWLPLFQMSRAEFGAVARSLLEVFPLVTCWRGNFSAERPMLLLIGHAQNSPFVSHQLYNLSDVPFLSRYAGNLTQARQLFADDPINSDDHPVIEYRAPISRRLQAGQEISWFKGLELIDFMARLQAASPPDQDPYLSRLEPGRLRFVVAGLYLHRANALQDAGRLDEQRQQRARYLELVNQR